MNPRARATRPVASLYLPPKGLRPAERADEQDRAAGGHPARLITREDGTTVVGSVALRCFNRRVYAYLRWSCGQRRTREMYLGDVSDSPDRVAALREAWSRFPGRHPVTTSAASAAPTT